MTIQSEIEHAWGSSGNLQLIAERENAVYKILIKRKPAALRLHRRGYQDDNAIISELLWTTRLAAAGFSCPKPIAQLDGSWMLKLSDGRSATVISWVEGNPIGSSGKSFVGNVTLHCDLYQDLGQLLAKLHNTTDMIQTSDLTRPAWDLAGLIGDNPLWGKFWKNPALSNKEKKFFTYAKDEAFNHLNNMKDLDFGLIHADALQENVFIDDGNLTLIDFDDSGFGYRSYELGVAISQHCMLPYVDDLISAIRDGYGRLRTAPTFKDIQFFLLLRSLVSVGWAGQRLPKKHPAQRVYIERAMDSANQWLT